MRHRIETPREGALGADVLPPSDPERLGVDLGLPGVAVGVGDLLERQPLAMLEDARA